MRLESLFDVLFEVSKMSHFPKCVRECTSKQQLGERNFNLSTKFRWSSTNLLSVFECFLRSTESEIHILLLRGCSLIKLHKTLSSFGVYESGWKNETSCGYRSRGERHRGRSHFGSWWRRSHRPGRQRSNRRPHERPPTYEESSSARFFTAECSVVGAFRKYPVGGELDSWDGFCYQSHV